MTYIVTNEHFTGTGEGGGGNRRRRRRRLRPDPTTQPIRVTKKFVVNHKEGGEVCHPIVVDSW